MVTSRSYKFPGFDGVGDELVKIPEQFFTEVLPRLQDIAEIKLILEVFRRVSAPGYSSSASPFRYVTESELRQDRRFLGGLGKSSKDGERKLGEALKKASQHGVLIGVPVDIDGKRDVWYFLNTEKGRQAKALIEEEGPEQVLSGKRNAESEHKNIFQLYEENIGLLQPLLAEELKEAAEEYPQDWIEEAFRIAAENNVRRWSYVRAILERWRLEGKSEPPIDTDSIEFRKRYQR
jgi:DNA replication protein